MFIAEWGDDRLPVRTTWFPERAHRGSWPVELPCRDDEEAYRAGTTRFDHLLRCMNETHWCRDPDAHGTTSLRTSVEMMAASPRMSRSDCRPDHPRDGAPRQYRGVPRATGDARLRGQDDKTAGSHRSTGGCAPAQTRRDAHDARRADHRADQGHGHPGRDIRREIESSLHPPDIPTPRSSEAGRVMARNSAPDPQGAPPLDGACESSRPGKLAHYKIPRDVKIADDLPDDRDRQGARSRCASRARGTGLAESSAVVGAGQWIGSMDPAHGVGSRPSTVACPDSP